METKEQSVHGFEKQLKYRKLILDNRTINGVKVQITQKLDLQPVH